MNELAEGLRRLTFHLESPDGSVTMDATGAGRIRIGIDPERLRRHTAETLAPQVDALVRGALTAGRRAYVQVRRQTIGAPAPATDPSAKPDEFTEELRGTPLEGRSRRGYVTAVRGEDRELRVRIEPGAPATLPAVELAAEIGSALHAALVAYDKVFVAAHRHAYGDSFNRLDLEQE